jgi:invasion protein IalB
MADGAGTTAAGPISAGIVAETEVRLVLETRHGSAPIRREEIVVETAVVHLASRARAVLFTLTALALVGLLPAGSGFAQNQSNSAAPDGTIKAQHGDWQVVCKPPAPGSKAETCALVQSVTAEDRNNVGLTVYFQKFSSGERVLRVFAPLGVLLPPGLGLKIDDKDVGHAPFLRCHNFACYAQVVAEDKLIDQLKTGKNAIFIIFQTQEAGIGIPISLTGFSQALAALK